MLYSSCFHFWGMGAGFLLGLKAGCGNDVVLGGADTRVLLGLVCVRYNLFPRGCLPVVALNDTCGVPPGGFTSSVTCSCSNMQ